MLNLAPFRLRLQPVPQRIRAAIDAGVSNEPSIADPAPPQHLALPKAPFDGVVRATDGRLRVTCVTDMPGVTPAMIDWWFGWHLPQSERYRLWHPIAHQSATVKDDRSRMPGDRQRYLDNTSYVDEYIGKRLTQLAISFVAPERFGFASLPIESATAICATTVDRKTNAKGGKLVHYVVAVPGGSQMRSGFWLAEIEHNVPIVDRLARGLLNRPEVRKLLVTDGFALDLLEHCGEEMQHLARFLPALYEAAHASGDA